MSQPFREQVQTKSAPEPPPFLSQAIVVRDTVYCSGQVGIDPTTGTLIAGSVADRTRKILENLNAVLRAAGSDLHEAVKVNVYLTDMQDFAAMNDVYKTFFVEPMPARTCVAVRQLPLGTDVEIECTAVRRAAMKSSSKL